MDEIKKFSDAHLLIYVIKNRSTDGIFAFELQLEYSSNSTLYLLAWRKQVTFGTSPGQAIIIPDAGLIDKGVL